MALPTPEISQLSAEVTSFCFDCPSANAGIDGVSYLIWIIGSIILAVPSFFAGMVIHRVAKTTKLWLCLLLVAISVPLMWFAWFFILDFSLSAPSFQESASFAVNKIDFVMPMVAGASLVASLASYFDGKQVRRRASALRFAEK